jgi:ribosome-associated protein
MPNVELRDKVIMALEERKGIDIKCLDVAGQTDIADYMIVATGSSSRQVKALTDSVVTEVQTLGVRPLGVEGLDPGEWVLVDLADVIVHIMLPATRDFYDLERLWSITTSRGEEGSGND